MPRKKSAVVSSADAIKLSKKLGRYRVSSKEDRTYDNIVFDSKWEAQTYKLLKMLLPADTQVHMQVPFLLQEKFKTSAGKTIREINYCADFVITREKDLQPNIIPGDAFVVDSKGHLTDIFKLKNKLFMYKYRTVIHQVKSAKDVADVVDLYKVQ
jgi:hypothetical protein